MRFSRCNVSLVGVATLFSHRRHSVRFQASSSEDMKIAWLVLASCVLVLAQAYVPYGDDDQGYPLQEDDYLENTLDVQQPAQKRACIRRGGNCDHRGDDCCYNSSCRCNLWGANCRCQRQGIFQKWG